MARNIPSNEQERPATKTNLPRKALNYNKGNIRSFPDKRWLKEYTSTKPALPDMLKGLFKKRKKNVRERGDRGEVQRG